MRVILEVLNAGYIQNNQSGGSEIPSTIENMVKSYVMCIKNSNLNHEPLIASTFLHRPRKTLSKNLSKLVDV